MILGNHDYMDNPQAQIDFTYHDANKLKLWKMPNHHYHFQYPNLNHHSTQEIPISNQLHIDFFGIDTCGCQGHVQNSHPKSIKHLHQQINWLENSLSNTIPQRWKFVFGHHPMYNKGKFKKKKKKYTHKCDYLFLLFSLYIFFQKILKIISFFLQKLTKFKKRSRSWNSSKMFKR